MSTTIEEIEYELNILSTESWLEQLSDLGVNLASLESNDSALTKVKDYLMDLIERLSKKLRSFIFDNDGPESMRRKAAEEKEIRIKTLNVFNPTRLADTVAESLTVDHTTVTLDQSLKNLVPVLIDSLKKSEALANSNDWVELSLKLNSNSGKSTDGYFNTELSDNPSGLKLVKQKWDMKNKPNPLFAVRKVPDVDGNRRLLDAFSKQLDHSLEHIPKVLEARKKDLETLDDTNAIRKVMSVINVLTTNLTAIRGIYTRMETVTNKYYGEILKAN